MSRLLTARHVADRLGVAPATVLSWTRNGALPGVRLPSGQLRYPEQAFEDWLAARATPRGDVARRSPDRDAALAANTDPTLLSTVRDDRRPDADDRPPKET